MSAVKGEESSYWSYPKKSYTTSKLWLGFGTEDHRSIVPFDCSDKYSISEQIYTASELGSDEHAITAIDFSMYESGEITRNIDVYMVHTDLSEFKSKKDFIKVSESDKVFSGSVKFVGDEWTTIKFDNSFIYNGIQNVALIIDENTGLVEDFFTSFYTYHSDKDITWAYSANSDLDIETTPSFYEYSNKNAVRISMETPYIVTVDNNISLGSIKSDRFKAVKGDTVTITPTANSDAYYCKSVTVNDGTVEVTRNAKDNTFSFIMPGENASVTAEFEDLHDVTVNWKNYDNTILETDYVQIMTSPVYNGKTPTRPSDDFYDYTFIGWDKEVTKVYDDTTYTAVYKASPIKTAEFTVCYADSSHSCLPYECSSNNALIGSEQIYPSSLLNSLKGKKLWSMTFYSSDDNEIDVNGLQVYLAEVDYDELLDNWVDPPENAVKVYDADYRFGGFECVINFDKPYEYGGGNLMVILRNSSPGNDHIDKHFASMWTFTSPARYKDSLNYKYSYAVNALSQCTFGFVDEEYHTVTWQDSDGTVLEIDNDVVCGDIPEYNGIIPENYENEMYYFTYTWDKEIKAVTETSAISIKAQNMRRVDRKYSFGLKYYFFTNKYY